MSVLADLRFATPEWLLLLVLLPMFTYRYFLEHRDGRASVRYSGLRVLQGLPNTVWAQLRHGLFVLKLLGLGCLMLAMARPQYGQERRSITADGIDIMLTIDVSSSMELDDLDEGRKSRLAIAKAVVAEFIEGRASDRMGLISFAAESFTQCPLTLDYGILADFLEQIEIADESWDGTAIGMALINACNRLRESDAKSKVVILLTDGVNNAGEIDPLTAADLAAAIGIRIYTIGVGSDGTIQRPTKGIFGTRYRTVRVEIDEEVLRDVAAQTGGRYFRATSEEKLEQIYAEIGELETTAVESDVQVDYSDRFQSFLWSGLGCLLFATVLSGTRFRTIP